MKKLSILIPSFYRGNKLERLLNSAKHLEETEVIVCFDSLDDPNILNIKNNYSWVTSYFKENSGLSATRNYLIAVAKTEYVLFVDDDDYIHPDFVKWWNSNYKILDKNVYKMQIDKFNENAITKKVRYKFSKKYLSKIDFFETNQVSSWLIKRSYFEKYIVNFNVGHIGEDHSFSARILANEKKIINTRVTSIFYDAVGEDKITKIFTATQLDKNLMEVDYLINNWKTNRFFLPKALDLVWGLSKQPDKWPSDTSVKLKQRLKKIKKHKLRILIHAPLWHKFAYLKFMFFPGF